MSANKPSRRRFLTRTLAASAVAATPHVLKAAVSHPPSEKLNVAVIGLGAIAGSHLNWLTQRATAHANLVGLCEVDQGHLPVRKNLAKHPQVKLHEDYRKMLEDKSIDAVVVCTPDHHHFPASMLAMKLGKHVYCEKPLTHTLEEARLLARASAECKVATQMGNQRRSAEGTYLIREWVEAGLLGNVRRVHLWHNHSTNPRGANVPPKPQGQAVPEGLDWNLFLGPAAARPYVDGYARRGWSRWVEFGIGMCGECFLLCWGSTQEGRMCEGLSSPAPSVCCITSQRQRSPWSKFTSANICRLSAPPR